jgi:hypothetical protein
MLSQSCVYVSPPVACDYTYADWQDCEVGGTQARDVLSSSPSGCVGTPDVVQDCTYSPPVCVFNYFAWGACQSDGMKERTFASKSPVGCTGTPVLSLPCTYTPSAMPMPVGSNMFVYTPVDVPVVDADPAQAKPIGVGSDTTGATLEMSLMLARLSDNARFSLGIYDLSFDPTTGECDASISEEGGDCRIWGVDAMEVSKADALSTNVIASDLASGSYWLILWVSPSAKNDSSGNYYSWVTSIKYTHADASGSPAGVVSPSSGGCSLIR